MCSGRQEIHSRVWHRHEEKHSSLELWVNHSSIYHWMWAPEKIASFFEPQLPSFKRQNMTPPTNGSVRKNERSLVKGTLFSSTWCTAARVSEEWMCPVVTQRTRAQESVGGRHSWSQMDPATGYHVKHLSCFIWFNLTIPYSSNDFPCLSEKENES